MQYHLWHALGMLAVGLAAVHFPGWWIKAAGWLLLAGIAAFSGSLYALALGAPKALGALAPVGGLALLLGWAAFGCAVIFSRTPG